MPNWCNTRFVLEGNRQDIDSFIAVVNSLPDREDVHENDFGKFWLGNLAGAHGLDWEKEGDRGVINPEEQECACMCCDDPDINARLCSEELQNGKSRVRFSTCSACDIPMNFVGYVHRIYPSLVFYYKSQDEFGQYKKVYDPNGLFDGLDYVINTDDSINEYNSYEKFSQDIFEMSGVDVRNLDPHTSMEDTYDLVEWINKRISEQNKNLYVDIWAHAEALF